MNRVAVERVRREGDSDFRFRGTMMISAVRSTRLVNGAAVETMRLDGDVCERSGSGKGEAGRG